MLPPDKVLLHYAKAPVFYGVMPRKRIKMSYVIVGTAGHVDHGKTCLIRALTGKNTDRLKEEQQRGITIELGFADMTAPDGTDIGIIDVPGHEKFIKNMLAGIGGIDVVLLVVAADEGVMPQTVEHLDIMRLLNIKRGIIVITKADLVEPDWIEMIEGDIREACRGCFLENAPAIAVSSETGQGIEELKTMLFDMIKQVEPKNNNPSLLRIPMDRVFTISGFGTVITGTLMQGTIRTGQEVIIYPEGISARVRNVQVHNQMVDAAFAGQRTAVNLTGIKKEDINRGDVLAAPGSITPSRRLDVKLSMLSDSKRSISSGDTLHFYYGARETLCKITLLDKDILTAGEDCYAQIYFPDGDEALKQDDLFVVRFFSPVETIGGGKVLDADAPRHKRHDEKVIEALRVRESGDDTAVLEQALKDNSRSFMNYEALAKQLGTSPEDALSKLQHLEAQSKAFKLSDKVYISLDYVKLSEETALKILREFHSKNPLTPGMAKEEFRSRFVSAMKIADPRNADAVLQLIAGLGNIVIGENSARASEFEVKYTKAQRSVLDQIKRAYKEAGLEAPETDAVLASFKDKTEARQLLMGLLSAGELVRLSQTNLIDAEALNRAVELVRSLLERNGSFTIAEFRDAIGTSRKFALLILGWCDARRITKLVDDKRIAF